MPNVSAAGDLHVIDVLTMPDRLDDRVGKPKGEDVLDGVFPEIVIDPIDLFLVKGPFDRPAERPGTGQVAPKWLLDDDARPAGATIAATRKAVPVEIFDDVGKKLGGVAR